MMASDSIWRWRCVQWLLCTWVARLGLYWLCLSWWFWKNLPLPYPFKGRLTGWFSALQPSGWGS